MTPQFKQPQQQKQQYFGVILFTAILICGTCMCPSAEARRVHKRFVIHLPYKIKSHHHTHTIYSHIRSSGSTKQTVYKILGYSSHHGHMQQHDYSTDDNKYMHQQQHHDCDDHKGGDMVFNHYARNDEQKYYPTGLEEIIEDDMGVEWEG